MIEVERRSGQPSHFAQLPLTHRVAVATFPPPDYRHIPANVFCAMPFRSGRIALLLPAFCVGVIAGCTTPVIEGRSPLAPVRMSPDSCVLDVVFLRFPFGDPAINGDLWQEVDEQQLPVARRRTLTRNGFRVGLIDGPVPVALSELLEPGDESGSAEADGQTALSQIDADAPVRRHLEIRADQRKVIVASGVHDQLSVLIADEDQIGGQTYRQAQAILAVKTYPQADGRVRIDLVPELQHGEVRQQWVGHQGMFRLEAGQQREVYDEMGVSATLSPGCMLVLTSLPNLPGSLGHHFFTEDDGRLEQKLLVVRLSQTQHDGLFGRSQIVGQAQ